MLTSLLTGERAVIADNTEYTFIYFIVHITTESYEYQHSQ